MPKAKLARKSTFIDMTPMVDLAFLLITFFMLTVKFKATEAIKVKTPSSISRNDSLLDLNTMTIHVSTQGAVYFGVNDKKVRMEMIKLINDFRQLGLTETEMATFTAEPQIGVPLKDLKPFLNMPLFERNTYKLEGKATGVSVDSTNNELGYWIVAAVNANKRINNNRIKVAVKADIDTPFPVMDEVFKTLKTKNISTFNLVTKQEAIPKDAYVGEGSGGGGGK